MPQIGPWDTGDAPTQPWSHSGAGPWQGGQRAPSRYGPQPGDPRSASVQSARAAGAEGGGWVPPPAWYSDPDYRYAMSVANQMTPYGGIMYYGNFNANASAAQRKTYWNAGMPGMAVGTPLYYPGGPTSNLLGSMSDAGRADMQASLVRAGLLRVGSFTPSTADTPTQNAWEELLTIANRQGMTWEQALSRMSAAGGGGANRTQVSTSTNTQVTTFTAADARQILKQAMGQYMGREPNDDEVEEFKAQISAEARANPSVSSSRTVTDASGNSRTTGTSKEGYGAGEALDEAEQQYQDTPEADRFQGGQFMDVLARMIGGW